MSLPDTLKEAARELARAVNALSFDLPTAYVYNPLDYAWEIHRQYLELAGGSKKKVVFLGMNPGPFGMNRSELGRGADVNELNRISFPAFPVGLFYR